MSQSTAVRRKVKLTPIIDIWDQANASLIYIRLRSYPHDTELKIYLNYRIQIIVERRESAFLHCMYIPF